MSSEMVYTIPVLHGNTFYIFNKYEEHDVLYIRKVNSFDGITYTELNKAQVEELIKCLTLLEQEMK